MKTCARSALFQRIQDESGQMLPWMAFLFVGFMGMGGMTIDLGRAYGCYRELQASTDAAAMAGAYEMSLSTATTNSVTAAVTAYSSASGGANANINLSGVGAPSVTLKCLTSVANQGVPCTASPTGDNAIQVTQTFAMPTLFIRALGAIGISTANSLTITTTATAAMRGATNSQRNVALVIDTTSSMGNTDTDAACGTTRIKCALQGAEVMLQSLSPCTPSSTT